MGLENLIENINKIAKSKGHNAAGASLDLNQCSKSDLLYGQFYLFVPDGSLHNKIKNKIKSFVKQEELHYVATTQEYCDDTHECHGHLVDPIKCNKENISIDKFPDNINGASFYFFSGKDFKTYKKITHT